MGLYSWMNQLKMVCMVYPSEKSQNYSLTYVLNPKIFTGHHENCHSISLAGIIRGVANLAYSTSGNNITFTGKADLTGGTGAFRDIKGTGLTVTH
jgi:hypothetical protein